MSRQGKGVIRWLGVSEKGVRWRILVEVEVEVEVEVVRFAEDEKLWVCAGAAETVPRRNEAVNAKWKPHEKERR